jgi:DNA-binding NarL/FixJ family response regulator
VPDSPVPYTKGALTHSSRVPKLGHETLVTTLNRLEKRIRIVLADDHAMFRSMCRNLLETEGDMDVVAEVVNADDVLGITAQYDPDILLLGLDIGGQRGFQALERLREAKLHTRVIAVCEHGKQSDCVRAVKLGCRGVLPENTPPDMILKSVRKVHDGELWLDRVTTGEVLRQLTQDLPVGPKMRDRETKISPLSPREREIVGLVTQGFKNKELAERLTISEQTVKNHMHNIFDKLGVSDRLELALYAIHNNLQEV